MKICPLIFAEGRLLPKTPRAAARNAILDGGISYGEFEFSDSITREDYFLSHQIKSSSSVLLLPSGER
jgi:hypothetical protein